MGKVALVSRRRISGSVRVGSYSFLGVNATIRDDISIGQACVIGAGALIMKSTKDREVYRTTDQTRFTQKRRNRVIGIIN